MSMKKVLQAVKRNKNMAHEERYDAIKDMEAKVIMFATTFDFDYPYTRILEQGGSFVVEHGIGRHDIIRDVYHDYQDAIEIFITVINTYAENIVLNYAPELKHVQEYYIEKTGKDFKLQY